MEAHNIVARGTEAVRLYEKKGVQLFVEMPRQGLVKADAEAVAKACALPDFARHVYVVLA